MKTFVAPLVLVFISRVSSITLECSFSTDFDGLYTCTDNSLSIDRNNEEIKEVKGNHFRGRTNENVLSVIFMSSGMKRLPRGVFSNFKNLKKYVVHGLDTVGEFLEKDGLVKGDFGGGKSLTSLLIMSVVLGQLRAKVFEGADNLNYLTLEACRIETIDKEAFKGLKKLHSLGLKFNYITTIHASTFSDLVELEHLLLSGNYLTSISKDLIKSMKNLNRLSLIGNRLTEIDPNLTEGMKNLESIYLDLNPCINEHFGSDGVPFSKFKKSIGACTLEGSDDHLHAKLQTEIKDLENEVASLQRLVEKYKSGNCGHSGMNIGGNDMMWMKRKATTKN